MPTNNPCMTEGCENLERCRGLCGTCYAAARGLVASEKTTWEFLASKGLCRQTVLADRTSRFIRLFEAAAEEATQ